MKVINTILFVLGVVGLAVGLIAFAGWTTMLLGNIVLEHYEIKTLSYKVAVALVLVVSGLGLGLNSSVKRTN